MATEYAPLRTSTSRLAARVAPFAVLLLLLQLGLAPRTHALPLPSTGDEAVESAPERRLYFGMWTFHFREVERGWENNRALGLSWGGIYGATFINSFGNRAFTGGVQGTLLSRDAGLVSLGLGYRAGLITGYDERFIPLAGRTPVIPLLQPLLIADTRRLGLELSYSGVIASAGLYFRF